MAEAAGAEEEAPSGGKKKLIVLALGGLFLLGGAGGGAAWFFGLLGGDEAHETAAAEQAVEAAGEHGADADGHGGAGGDPGEVVFVSLPDVLVNLQSDGKRMRFLKLKVALEARGEKTASGIKELTPRIMDSFQMYLRALTLDEINGSSALVTIKQELMARINSAIAPHVVDDVLVKEMLVQ